MERSIYLPTAAIQLLLFREEITGLMMPGSIVAEQSSDCELTAAVESMIRDGFLLPGDDGRFKMNDYLRSVMDVLSEAEETERIVFDDPHSGDCYMFIGKQNAVLMGEDAHRQGYVKICCTGNGSADAMLEERSISSIEKYERGNYDIR